MAESALARFDWRGFGRALRRAIDARGLRSLRRLAPEIGVTYTDLSRASSGGNVSVEKAIALCDWIGDDLRNFYVPPMKSNCCTSIHVKHTEVSG